MKKQNKWKDPHQEREQANYAQPIPSRELILEYFASENRCLQMSEVGTGLQLKEEWELDALGKRLRAMVRDGQLILKDRAAFCVPVPTDMISGRILAHPDGFGFLEPDDGTDDVFLSPKEMRSVFHHDRAKVYLTGFDHRGKREGRILEVIERNTQRVVGRLIKEQGVAFVIAEDKRIPQDILISAEEAEKAAAGEMVVVEILEQPSQRSRPIGKIVEVLGKHMAPGMEIDVAIRSFNIPQEWDQKVQQEIKSFSEQVPESAKKGRVDISQLPLVTIDGEDARDFDDAVYCEATPKGWKLLVAIADVSAYVHTKTALDQAALERGNSVYFPERVIPMLPEILSNGLCSLMPNVDRLCMVAELVFDQTGKMIRSKFFEGLMHSAARLTYTEVAAILVDGDEQAIARRAPLVPHLQSLYQLYQVLAQARGQRGAIDFDTTETRILFGDEQKIEKIVPLVRNDAHKLIEECMIAANVAAARFLTRHKLPTLFRIHEPPKMEKVEAVREFLREFGLELGGGENPEPSSYAKLLESLEDKTTAHLIQTVLLRSLNQAVYSPDNKGHYGLSLPAYLHFTSPIRRYPDLLVHRAIRHVLQGGNAENFAYSFGDIEQIGMHCSETERRADEATRDVMNWLKCEFMLDKVGEEFTGVIVAVTSFGFFVELNEIYVDGLVHVTSLGGDYYVHDAVGHRLVGERTRQSFRLGDGVSVRVMRVDLDDRKIDFECVGQPKKEERPSRKTRSEPTSEKSDKKNKKRHRNKKKKRT